MQQGGYGGGYPQQQNYGWPGMMQGYGGGYGQQQYGQYQPQTGQAQPQQADANAPAGHRAALNQRIGDLQAQWGAAGTQDQGAIQQRIDGLQGRVQNLKDNRQAARQAQAGPASAPGAPQAGAPQGATQYNNEGTYGWQNQHAGANDPVMSLGTQSFNTNFGNLVPSSGGQNGVYKRNGGDENTLYNFANGQWNSMTGDQYRANPNATYQAPTNGAASGQQMQNFYHLGAKPPSGFQY